MSYSIKGSINLALQFISLLLGIVLVYRQFLGAHAIDPYKCQALESGGKWIGKHRGRYGSDKYLQWQPPGCLLHQYSTGEINTCFGGERLLFIGDSGIRQLFFATAKKLDRSKTMPLYLSADKHSDLTFSHGGMTIDFIWDPYLNSSSSRTELNHYRSGTSAPNSTRAGAVLVGSGLWQAKNLGSDYLNDFKRGIDGVASFLPQENAGSIVPFDKRKARDSIFFTPVPLPIPTKLDETRVNTMAPQKIQALNEYLRLRRKQSQIEVLWSYSVMTWLRPSAYQEDGYHVVENVAERFADIVLNVRCNGSPKLPSESFLGACCRPSKSVNLVQLALLLGAVVIASISLYHLAPRSLLEPSEKSIAARRASANIKITHYATFAMAALYCFCADRTQLFDRLEKTTTQRLFLQLISLAGLAGLATIRRSEGARPAKVVRVENLVNFMSRQQTEEWKGWMQFVILFYHYTGMSKVLWVYQLIRVLVASYLFMTGYGHTLYFLNTKDFSLRRVTTVLVRLNLLSCLLAYLMGTDYVFYYFPAICSFWFLVIYLTVKIKHQPNAVPTLLIGKVVISAVVVNALLRQSNLLEWLFKMTHMLFQTHVDVCELRFRLALDSIIVYAGMLAAILSSQLTGGLPCSTTCAATNIKRFPIIAQAFAVAISLITLPSYFYLVQFFPNKELYNTAHPWISPLPVLAFVVLRNSLQPLRDFHSICFAWIGRFSLETFILQYHIWLAADSKAILSLGLWTRTAAVGRSWPSKAAWMLDVVLVSAMFLWTSWGTAQATTYFATTLASDKWMPSLRGVPNHVAMRKSSSKISQEDIFISPGRARNTSIQLEGGIDPILTTPSLTGVMDSQEQKMGPKVRLLVLVLLTAVGNWLYY